MGAVCCKSSRVRPSRAKDPRMMSLVEIELKTKKDFQRQWEESHSLVQVELASVWGLTIGYQNIHSVYTLEEKAIGANHYGVIKRAKLGFDPSQVYAVKIIKKDKLTNDINPLKNEFELLRFLDHPNILKFYEIFQDTNHYYFVMEYCDGGSITTYIEKNGALSEELTKNIMFQVLQTLAHLHACGIAHRDIKPDNFLLKNKDINSPIKLTDFSLSRKFTQGSTMYTLLGTPSYVAPELLMKKGYTHKADLWSAGVMMYLMLAAKFPFKGETSAMLFQKIKIGDYDLSASPQLKNLSGDGVALLCGLLEKDPNKRLSAHEALRQPWFDELNIQANERGKKLISKDILGRLRGFSAVSNFWKEVIRLLVMIHDDSPHIQDMYSIFFYIDVLGNGVINNVEIEKLFASQGEHLSEKEVQDIVTSLELRTKNTITYSEFITAVLDPKFYKNDKYLTEAFRRFDVDNDGFISYQDVQNCFTRFGVSLSKSETKKMIKQFDENTDTKLSCMDFIRLMKGDSRSRRSKSTIFSPQRLAFMNNMPSSSQNVSERNLTPTPHKYPSGSHTPPPLLDETSKGEDHQRPDNHV